MKLEPMLLVLLLVAIWLFGGIVAILLIAIENKKRLGKKLFFHIKEDVAESPLPAWIGYIFVFMFGWLTLLRHFIAFVFDAMRFVILLPQRLRFKKG